MPPKMFAWVPSFIRSPVERDYPWRYTSLTTFIFFLLLTVSLIIFNIPIAAYEVVTVNTNTPNETDTSSIPLFFDWIPSIMRPDINDFDPFILKKGDTFKSNFSLFEYEVFDIQERDGKESDSFGYRNQPLRTCDIQNIQVDVNTRQANTSRADVSALISCWEPSMYTLSVQIKHDGFDKFFRKPRSTRSQRDSIVSLIDVVLTAFEDSSFRDIVRAEAIQFPVPSPVTSASVLIQPCCQCDGLRKTDYALTSNGSWIVDHLPCGDAIPARLLRSHLSYEVHHNSWAYFENSALAGNGKPTSDGGPLDFFSDNAIIIPDSMTPKFHNVVQVMYHALRLDLGVISSNSIFTNPTTYNQTLIIESSAYEDALRSSPVYIWKNEPEDENRERTLQSLSDMFLLLQPSVINTSDTEEIVRVPRLTYIAHRMKVRSKLSASVKVFVAVFAMLSSTWAVWKILLTFLAERGETKKSGYEEVHTVVHIA